MMMNIRKYLYTETISDLVTSKNPVVWYVTVTIVLLLIFGIRQWNENSFLTLFNLAGANSILDYSMIFGAKYLFLIILFLSIAYVYIREREHTIKIIVAFLFIGALSYILSLLMTHVVTDIRPYILYHIKPLIAVAKDNGFPSDHALISFLPATVISLYTRKVGWILYALACFVGISRIYVAAHHPLDIVGSMGIVAVALCVYIGCNYLIRRVLIT